jgi:tetratricopeptide (TPR) repeat protein
MNKIDVSLSSGPFWPYLGAAAVLTDFDPEKLRPMQGYPPPDDASMLALMLMEHGEAIRIGPAKGNWSLSDRSRSATLVELKRQKALHAALQANVGTARPDNPTQQAIDQLIETGVPAEPGPKSLSELLGLYRALEMLGAVVDSPPDFYTHLIARIEQLRLLEPLQRLLVHGFAGREEELRTLRSYVDELESESFREILKRSFDNVVDIFRARPLLVIWGPGGVGKSTLIAKFLLDHAGPQQKRPIPFVYLDCDQGELNTLRPDSFLAEALRQIQVQFPDFAGQAAGLEADSAARMVSEDGESISRSAHFSQSAALRDRFAQLVRAISDANKSNVLFFIDTFEVVQRRGPTPVFNVLTLAAELMRSTPRLRIVVASRVCLRDGDFSAYAGSIPCWKQLPLKGFDAAAGRLYLENRLAKLGRHGLSPAILDRIVSLVRGNPLSLRLGAQIFARNGEGALEDAVAEAKFDAEFTQERLQGVLHNRLILNLEPRVRKIADPGLVIRRLTPEIIEMVLDQVCGLGIASPAEAESLFQSLRDEVTLFEVAGPRTLRHRPDVRLLMLPLLRAELGEQARQIDMAAVRFWSGKDDPEARAEEIYHLLWLGATERALDAVWDAGTVSRPLMEDALDEFEALDGSTAARIWLCRKLEREISPALESSADLVDWERNAERGARSLLASGSPSEALAALRGRSERTPASPLWGLEIEALKLLARDEEARTLVEQALQRAVGAHSPRHVVSLLLQKASLLERAADLPGAFDTAGHAAALASELEDAVLGFEAKVTQARVARIMNDTALTKPLRDELVRLLDNPAVRDRVAQRPALLRETTAEVGDLRSDLFIWASIHLGKTGSNPLGDAAGLITLGVAHAQRAELDQAQAALERARDIATEFNDDRLLARVLLQLANVCLDRYDIAGTTRHLDQALVLAKQLGDLPLESLIQGALGNVRAKKGDFEGAIQHYSRSLDMTERLGDRVGQASALGNLANAHTGLGQWSEAAGLLEQALEIAQELGDRHAERQTLGSLATIWWIEGDLQRAIDLYEYSLTSARTLGDIRGECATLSNLGSVHAERGELGTGVTPPNPSLKIGKYIATTSPPISVPRMTMISGSISEDSAATASSTSSSKKSATLPSMPSSAPDSSPMATICVTRLGNTFTFCIATVRLVPVETSVWMRRVASR